MALERVPADIRAQGGVARMSDPALIKEIQDAVTIPVMAKARIGHIVECQVWLNSYGRTTLITCVDSRSVVSGLH
jgi:pyridoxal biosynthesis lyase PdxS